MPAETDAETGRLVLNFFIVSGRMSVRPLGASFVAEASVGWLFSGPSMLEEY